MYFAEDSFWNAQIEQIHVLPGKNIELVPRVGDHLIYLGKMAGFEKKLKRVKAFYERGLNQVGWNKYSRINVEFDKSDYLHEEGVKRFIPYQSAVNCKL